MKVFISIIILLASVSVSAASVEGKVKRIYANGDLVNFRLENDACKPSVSGGKYWRFYLYSENADGTPNEEANALSNAYYAMLLAAATSGKPIRVAFTAPCDPSNHEFVNYIYQQFD